MVDSENSTSLPSVTRRTLLRGAISSAVIRPVAPASDAALAEDPIVSLWRDWRSAYAEATAWCARAGAIEHAMVREVGFPRVQILSVTAIPAWTTSHGDIDTEMDRISATDGQRTLLHADLTEQQARWNAAADATGLNAADRNEAEAWAKSERLADALFALPADGLMGVLLKFKLILKSGEAEASLEERPWPQIQSIFDDLSRIAGVDDVAG